MGHNAPPEIDLTDETVLAYALELGKEVRLVQRLPNSRKTETLSFVATRREDLSVKDVFRRTYNREIAHFVLRQWTTRTVKVAPPRANEPKSKWTWTVSGTLGGDAIVFTSQSPEQVIARMNLSLTGPKATGCSPVVEARDKLAWLAANEQRLIVAARRAEAVWPPKPGSLRAKGWEWTKACDRFYMSKSTGPRWSSLVAVSPKPVLAKFKDVDFHLLEPEFVNDFETPGRINLVCNRVIFC